MSASQIITVLGSWWLTALLLLSLESVYLVLSFGRNPYPAWVNFLFHSPGGIAIYFVLIVNLTTASIRIVLSRLLRPALSPELIRSMDVHVEFPQRDDQAIRRAAELLPIQVSIADITEKGWRQVTGQLSFLPGTVFRAGLVLTLISLMVTARGRTTYDTAMREGERKDILGSSITLANIDADLPVDHLQVGEDGTFLLEGVSARVDAGGSITRVTPGSPSKINGLWYRVRHLSYSQALTVNLRGSRSEISADLDLLPPGRSSSVSLPSGNTFVTFSLAPDRTISKGVITGRQYNLAHPVYLVAVQEGKPREDAKGTRLKPGERGAVGPAEVVLGKQGLAIRFQIVSDPGLPFLYAGVIIMLAGLCAMVGRFFWYEREFAVMVRDGMLIAGSRDEFFKKWGVHQFERWKDALMADLPGAGK